MKKTLIITILLSFHAFVNSQNTISGTFPGVANQKIKLVGFIGFQTYTIDSTKADEKGEFKLSYGKSDYGMGYLLSKDDKIFILVLEKDAIQLQGSTFTSPETIGILKGKENQLFEQYASEHPRREQALSAWVFLEKIYSKDSLFAVQEIPKQAIVNEKQRIKTEDSLFLTNLPKHSYLSYYLPLRKLVSSVSTIAQYRTEEIPATIEAFRKIDYADPRLQKSGLLADIIESHFWLIENSGRSLDSAYIEMNKSIDILIENILQDNQKLNDITEYLFKYLEKRSLFEASKYLSLKMLNENSIIIDYDFAAQLEKYSTMKTGNTAPDILIAGDVLMISNTEIQKLSDIESDYIFVVFGASWCPACSAELTQIANIYNKWKSQNIEVVFVSLDENEKNFKNFTKDFPFISICYYQKWKSQPVIDYHIFETPTFFLLDNNLEIILKPNSVNQMDAWVDWFLVNGYK